MARTAPEARAALAEVIASARATSGNLAVLARWTGDPGRSPSTLTLAPEVTSGDALAVVHLDNSAGDGEGPLGDPGVIAELAAGLGADGVPAVAHNAKERCGPCCPRASTSPGWPWTRRWPPTSSTRRSTSTGCQRPGRAVSGRDGRRRDRRQGQGAFALDPRRGRRGAGAPGSRRRLGLVRLAAVLARLRRPLGGGPGRHRGGELFDEIERPLVRVLARMEVSGSPLTARSSSRIAKGLADECAVARGHHARPGRRAVQRQLGASSCAPCSTTSSA